MLNLLPMGAGKIPPPLIVNSPILTMGMNLKSISDRVLLSTVAQFYGPNLVHRCYDRKALNYKLRTENVGYLMYICDGENAEEIKTLFDYLAAEHSDIKKIVALNVENSLVQDDIPDLGQDERLLFSEGYLGDEFTTELRRVIGPSLRDEERAIPIDHWRVQDGKFVREPSSDTLRNCVVKYSPVNECFNQAQLSEINDYYKGERNITVARLQSYCPHLSDCTDCAKLVEKLDGVIAAGINMICADNQLVFELDDSGFQVISTEDLVLDQFSDQ